MFQYRAKAVPPIEAYYEASQLRVTAADAGVLFLVNDRCDLALAVEADGVHVGQDDLPLAYARKLMGTEKIIGVSTHGRAQVEDAVKNGADYLGFGPIYHTGTKPDHQPVVGLGGLRQIRSLTTLPLFAIGGVTLETAPTVLAAGADGIAVISAILDAPSIGEAVCQLLAYLS